MTTTTSRTVTITKAERAKITADFKAYGKMRRVDLEALVRRNYRVISITKETSKRDLVGLMMEATFGRRRLEAYDTGVCSDDAPKAAKRAKKVAAA